MSELRWNPLLNEWIISSPKRKKRYKKTNPFSKNSPEMRGREAPLILPNRYPNFSINKNHTESESFYNKSLAYGTSDVLIETNKESGDFNDYTIEDICKILNLISTRMKELEGEEKIEYVFVFKNKGKEVGSSLPHPHMQIYGMPFVPPVIQKEIESCKDYYEKNKKVLFKDIIDYERKYKKRILYENENFFSFVPYFSKWPYESQVVIKESKGKITDFKKDDIADLAEQIKLLTECYNNLFSHPMSYVLLFHQAPLHRSIEYFNFFIEFQPVFQMDSNLKYTAGIERAGVFEHGSGEPEDQAQTLRLLMPD